MKKPRRSAAIMLATIFLLWGVVFAYFSATGRAWLFWVTTLESPRAYGGSIAGNLRSALWRMNLIPKFLVALLPVALLSLFALFGPGRKFLIAFIVGAFLAIAIPGQFFVHYYQLWIVPLTIGAGWGMSLMVQNGMFGQRWLAPTIAVIVLAGMITWQIPSYLRPPMDWALENYKSAFVDDQQFGRELASVLEPGDTFYDWSNAPWLYFVTHRRPPAVGIWRSHTIEGPLANWLTDQTLKELQQSPPRYVTMWARDGRLPDHPIDRWIHENYRVVDDPQRWRMQFLLMERKAN